MRTVLFENFKRKISAAAIGRWSPKIDDPAPFWILSMKGPKWKVLKLMEGTKIFCKFLHISYVNSYIYLSIANLHFQG